MKKWVFCALWVAGCRSATLPTGEPAPVIVDDEASRGVGGCAAIGAPCETSDQCCAGYCETYLVYSLDWHTCKAHLPDGSYCNHDRECESGRCVDARCVSATCENECSDDSDCCPGSYCERWSSYGPTWDCVPQLGRGERCFMGSMCRTGRCLDGKCA